MNTVPDGSTARPVSFDRARASTAGPELRVVAGTEKSTQRSAIAFLFVCALLLATAIIVPLVANTNMARLAYDMREVSLQINDETAQIQTLEGKILEESSPAALRAKAAEIGMVPAAPIGIIVMETGQVEGGEPAR